MGWIEINKQDYEKLFKLHKLNAIESFTDIDGTNPIGYGRPHIETVWGIGDKMISKAVSSKDKVEDDWKLNYYMINNEEQKTNQNINMSKELPIESCQDDELMHKLNSMHTNFGVVKKLVGNIKPTGITEVDNERMENLEEMCKVMLYAYKEIESVAGMLRPESSVNYASNYAKVHIVDLKHRIEEFLNGEAK